MKTVAETLDALPGGGGKNGARQYIYVVELTNGVVKVGRTATPRRRMWMMSLNGHGPKKLCVFDSPNSSVVLSERALIQSMSKVGVKVRGKREFFHNISFEMACHRAKQISTRKMSAVINWATLETEYVTDKRYITARLKNIRNQANKAKP